EAGRVVIDGDAVMAGQRQLQPAADAEAGNAGDERDRKIFDALEHRMRAPERFGQDFRVAHLVEFGNVRPGDEPRLTREQDDPGKGFLLSQMLDMGEEAFEFADDLAAEDVDRAALDVQRQPADLLDIDRKVPVPGLWRVGLRQGLAPLCCGHRISLPYSAASV